MQAENLAEYYIERLIYIENTTNNVQHKVVFPNNSISLTFQFGEPVFEINGGRKLPLPFSAICGQLTKAKEFIFAQGSKMILVKFKPWAARFFFDCELHKYINQIIPLKHFVKSHPDASLNDEFLSVPDKQRIIVGFLQEQFKNISIDHATLQAINIIYSMNGQVKVDDLARKVFTSKRNLERKFKVATGLSPKKFIVNSRFQNGLHFLYEKKGLYDIAYDCGYWDQSHFSNDIKRITGITADNISPRLCRISPINSVFMSSSLQYKRLS